MIPVLMDPRSVFGNYLRGRNIYKGGSYSAHSGAQPLNSNMGRPPIDPREALFRRLRGNFSNGNQFN